MMSTGRYYFGADNPNYSSDIRSTDDMVKYLERRLGFPVLDPYEGLSVEHFYIAIRDTLDFFYRYNADEASIREYMVLHAKAGQTEYQVPDSVTDIIDAQPTYGNMITPFAAFDLVAGNEVLLATNSMIQWSVLDFSANMRYLADIRKLMGIQYDLKLDPQSHTLRVLPTPRQDRTLMCRIYRKSSMARVYGILNFRDMAFARIQIIWGSILDFDTYTFPNGGKVNGQALRQAGEKSLTELEKRVKEESAPPMIQTDLT